MLINVCSGLCSIMPMTLRVARQRCAGKNEIVDRARRLSQWFEVNGPERSVASKRVLLCALFMVIINFGLFMWIYSD